MPYFDKLRKRIAEINSVVCVGLDTDFNKIPDSLKRVVMDKATKGMKLEGPSSPESEKGEMEMHKAIASSVETTVEIIFRFNRGVIGATLPYAACYKLTFGFYLGEAFAIALRRTVSYLHKVGALSILDFKNSDIGNSAERYANYAFNDLGVDAVTVNPYLGHADSLDKFTRRADKGVYVLCATSNGKDDPNGATLFQERRVMDDTTRGFSIGGPSLSLSEVVAEAVATKWNGNANCGLVVGATRPDVFELIRNRAGEDMPFLIPGFGEQEGDIERPMKYGCSTGVNAVGNISRQLLYGAKGEDRSQLTVDEYFAAVGEAARKWRDTFNQFRPVPAEVTP